MTGRERREDESLASWAEEHLVYEVDMMVFALEQLAGVQPESLEANLALESFAVHARCLFEFLWCKPNPNHNNDAFASDFSDQWNERRNAIPKHLAEVKDRKRFGQEVFHLTYKRASGSDERKIWLCGEMAMEIAKAFQLFAELARDDSLDKDTRARLGSIAVKVRGDNGDLSEEILRLSHRSLAAVTGATTMDPSQFKDGTLNVRDIEVGS